MSYSDDNPVCPKCGGATHKRSGKFGPFFGCANYPTCKGIAKAKYVARKAIVRNTGPRPEIVGSSQQLEIWDYISNGEGHLCVEALAGTGKSTTCREAMHRVNPALRCLYLAFNKAIADEFTVNAPANCVCSTLNAIGFAQVRKSFPRVQMVNGKVRNIIEGLYTPTTKTEIDAQRMIVNATDKLVGLCQGLLITGDDKLELTELAANYDIELSSDIADVVLGLVPQVLKIDRERTGVISFNDMLWLPVVLNLPCDKYDLIFVDEAQDLNACQHKLVLGLLAAGGRVVIVGDTNQAIYGFRGSDVDSIANFATLLESNTDREVITLPLTVTRRCGKAIVAEAAKIVPTFEAHENNGDGEVIRTNSQAAGELYTPGDMVLCKMNAPLASVAFTLIKRGVKAIIRGRDLGQNLITLIQRLKSDSVGGMLLALDVWEQKEIEKVAGTRREDTVTQQINDRADCIRALSEDCDNISEVIARIQSVFADFEASGAPKGAVILSSIHKAKGLEADTIFWYDSDIQFKCKQDWQARQQRNLEYVAITRAKRTLYYVSVAKKGKAKPEVESETVTPEAEAA